MKNKRFVMTAAAFCLAATLTTGCGSFSRDYAYKSKYSVTTLKSADEMEDGGYYVKHTDGSYDKLYAGKATFNLSDSGPSEDDSHVLWFGKDYDCIPTMLKGESIVYHNTKEFSGGLTIERFEDLGYTIGIADLTRTSTGRYSFSTDTDDLNIDLSSDAGGLYQLGDHTVVLDKIGSTPLRSGNISRAGTILGLTRGKTYAAYLYIGTELKEYNLVADVRAMASMDGATLTDYTYASDNVIEFKFPSSYQSGYYLVAGYGVVRYIASGDGYKESMDMNIPNAASAETDSSADSGTEEQPVDEITKDTREMDFKLGENANVTVELTYTDSADSTDSASDSGAPTAKVIGDYGVYTLNPDKKTGKLTVTADMHAGSYRLQVIGLAGRKCSYRVIKNKALDSDATDSGKTIHY